MNSWWLKLYTIPGIKKIAMSFLIPLSIVFCGHFLGVGKELMFFLHFSFIYPMLAFGHVKSEGFVWNLEFHKMSVPLKELRKIFFLDVLIQSGAFLFLAA